MNNNSLEKAKELFFRYSCSRAGLYSDNRLNEYEAYDITQEIERQWIVEYVKRNIDFLRTKNKITIEYAKSISLIKDSEFIYLFKDLINLIDEKFYEYDSLSKVKIFQSLLDICDSFSDNKDIKLIAKNFLVSKIGSLDIEKLIFISERYEKHEIPTALDSEVKLKIRFDKIKRRLNELV